jgi:hypothetical protein
VGQAILLDFSEIIENCFAVMEKRFKFAVLFGKNPEITARSSRG